MAPNPTNKILYSRMVQPALPLVPGRKANKPKATPAPGKAGEICSEPNTNTVVNGGSTETKAKSPTHLSPVATSGDSTPGEKEEFSSAGSLPVTPLVLTPALPDIVAASVVGSSDNGKETLTEENNVGAEEETHLAVNVADSNVADSNVADSNVADSNVADSNVAEQNGGMAVASIPVEQSADDVVEDGQDPASPQVTVGEQHEQHATGQPELTVQTDLTTANDMANGTAQDTPAEDSGLSSEKDQNHPDHVSEAPLSTPASEQHLNGLHLASTMAPPGHLATLPRPFNGLLPLPDYLLQVAATKDGADWAIQVTQTQAQPFITYTHGIIMSRSPRLRRLMDRQQSNSFSGNLITVYPARFVLSHAFEAALRFLYSDTVLSNDFFVQPHPGPDFQAARLHNLDYILSYWTAGIELGIEPVAVCAERLLSNYLDWDILEITYKHAMDLASSPLASVGKNLTGSDYIVASNSLVRSILQFLAARIDIPNFRVDLNASPSLFTARLPQVDEGRGKANPALSSMVFGSMPSSADMSPSSPRSEILPTPTVSTFRDTVASNLLLNVDFEGLNVFNNFIHARRMPGSAHLMAAVVNERENRRLKVLQARHISTKERMGNSTAWDPVGMKESMHGNILSRERVGFLLPY